MPEYADHFRTQTRAPLLMVLAVAMLLAACQPNPVLSKKCDVNEGLKDRFFGATEEDEGRPLDVGWQRQASNQAVRLGLKRPRS